MNGRLFNSTPQALFDAQGERLAESLKDNFALQTDKNENAEKIEKLADYEQKIAELTKMRQLWWVGARVHSGIKVDRCLQGGRFEKIQ